MLVRLQLGYTIPASEWSPTSVLYVWKTTFRFPVASVGSPVIDPHPEHTGASWTTMSSEAWFYDEDAAILYVWQATGDGSPPSGSYAITVRYNLLLTDGVKLELPRDPTAATGYKYPWLPRLREGFAVRADWAEVLAGVVEIAANELSIENADGLYDEHLASSRSFGGYEVVAWLKVGDEIERVYTGKTQAVSSTDTGIAVRMYDALSDLSKPAYMVEEVLGSGVSAPTTAILKIATTTTLNPQDEGKPVKHVWGKFSYIKYQSYVNTSDTTTQIYKPIEMEAAHCVSYSANKTNALNRTWRAARMPSGGLRTQTIGTVDAEFQLSTVRYIRFSSHDLIPGEWVKFTVAGTARCSKVVKVGTFTYSGTSYNCAFEDFAAGYPAMTGSLIEASADPIVTVYQPSETTKYFDINPLYYSVTTTSNAYYGSLIDVVFQSGAELNHSGMATIDPDQHTVYVTCLPAASAYVGECIQSLLEYAGFTVDATTVDDFDTDLALQAASSIPAVGESDYRSYREYLQDMLRSAGAYVRLNADGEVELHALAAPTGGTVVLDSDIVPGSYSVDHDYQDMAYELQPGNEHNPTYQAINTTSDTPAVSATDEEVLRLHPLAKARTFNHLLYGIESRIDYLLSLRSSPRRIHSFRTTGRLAGALVGDQITVQSALVRNTDDELDLIICGLEKSADGVTVRALELP